MCDFGRCKTSRSDNGPQFTSAQFKNFVQECDLEHITSSSRYPQNNSFIERMVGLQTAESIMDMCKETGTPWRLGVTSSRNTPIAPGVLRPSQHLQGRALRDEISRADDILHPKSYDVDI